MADLDIAKITEAVDQVRSLSRFFESVQKLAGVLGDAVGLQQYVQELKNLHAEWTEKAGKAKADMDSATSELERLRSEHQDAIAQHRMTSDAIVKEAKAEAYKTVADANQEAERVKAEAKAIVNQLNSVAEEKRAQIATLDGVHADLSGKIQAAREKVSALLQSAAN